MQIIIIMLFISSKFYNLAYFLLVYQHMYFFLGLDETPLAKPYC